MKTLAKIILGSFICGIFVSFALAVFNTFVMRVEWLDTKKESSWPRLFTYEDKAYWVTRDQNNLKSWVILGVQQK